MKIKELLSLNSTANNVTVDSKKSVLELISKLLVQNLPEIPHTQILECLVSREKLGSTGIGHGVAIPHGRIENLTKAHAALVRLKKPIDFEAIDNQPIDIFFGLLVPESEEGEYLEILSDIAAKFSNKEFRNKLRAANSDQELYEFAIGG